MSEREAYEVIILSDGKTIFYWEACPFCKKRLTLAGLHVAKSEQAGMPLCRTCCFMFTTKNFLLENSK
jgi:hypothetical protein